MLDLGNVLSMPPTQLPNFYLQVMHTSCHMLTSIICTLQRAELCVGAQQCHYIGTSWEANKPPQTVRLFHAQKQQDAQ